MPICGRCGIDQPEDAFSTESQPLCETCYEIEIEEEAAGGEIGNDTTTAAGVIAGNNGRQYEGSEKEDNEDEPASKPRKKVELSNAARILDQDGKILGEQQDQDPPDLALLEPLVKAVEERGYSAGFGLDSQEVLKYRLQRVLFDPDNAVITWLTRPLIPALIHGTPELLQKRVTPLNIQNKAVIEEQTLLHWLCQWKLLQLQCGWKGHDDIVDLLLRAGADPNATLANGCTPLFFSVKYATVDTLRLLIDGGANPNQKDNLRQTCLRNALPQASPYIIKFLLKYIPANETFQTETFDGSKLKINALDILVTEFVTPSPDISWANLGMPSVEDYAQCIILFLQRGVQLSPHYPDVTYFLGHYLQGSIQAKKRLYYTRKIADLVFGQWLPPLIQEEVVASNSKDNKTLSSTTSSKECPMCLTSNDTKCKPNNTPIIALYCGHYFCEEHLRTHVTSVHAATDLQKIMSCPTCIRPLCKDILGDHPPTENDADLLPLQQQRRLGLMRLGLEQLQFECKARNLEVPQDHLKEHCLESLVADWRDFTVPQSYMEQGDDDEVQMSSRLIFELSMSRTMISQDHYLWVAPTQGSVMIPITAKGIPIMALVSTTSPYTVVSPRFVQMFGLCTNSNLQYTARNPLKFTRAQGDDDDEQDGVPERPINHNDPEEEEAKPRPKPTFITAPEVHLTAVEGFTFTLGNHNGSGSNTAGGFDNIEVRLDSVFQISEPNTHLFPVGVVLGLDFFQSAAWTQMSVEVDLEVCLGRTIALFTGGLKTGSGLHFDLVEPRRADFIEEEFRYYSHDGKIFWTPLWHVYVSKYDYCLSLEQYLAKPQPPPERGEMLPPKETQVEMVECAYCCRKFLHDPKGDSRSLWDILLSKPKNLGMIHCRLCEKDKPTFYCDEHCRQKAQVAHSILRHYGTDFSRDTRIEDAASIYKKTLAFWITLTAVIAAIYVMPGGKSENGVENVAGQADMQSDALKFQKGSGEEENTTLFSASKSPTDFVSEL